MFSYTTAILSDVPGYEIGSKINPNSGNKFSDNMLTLLEEELSPERLFELTSDRKHGFCLENIMAAVRSATLTAGLDAPQIDENSLGEIIKKTGNETFLKHYLTLEQMNLDFHPVESFAIAYVIYETEKYLRTIPNFPKEPIQYKDIIPTLGKNNMLNLIGEAVAYIIDKAGIEYDMIATVEARGNFLAAALHAATGKGIIPIRKEGKLPPEKFSVQIEKYDGKAIIEIENNPEYAGKRVLIFDDVIGSGGSDKGVRYLCDRVGANVVGSAYIMGIPAEHYKEKNIPNLFTLMTF